jgi:hypothetical protein
LGAIFEFDLPRLNPRVLQGHHHLRSYPRKDSLGPIRNSKHEKQCKTKITDIKQKKEKISLAFILLAAFFKYFSLAIPARWGKQH